jgi:hypothetical protein
MKIVAIAVPRLPAPSSHHHGSVLEVSIGRERLVASKSRRAFTREQQSS